MRRLIFCLGISIGAYGQYSAALAPSETGHAARVQPSDQIFPHIAIGGGWSTYAVLVNMGQQAISFQLRFYGQDGAPLTATFRNPPFGEVLTTSSVQSRIGPGQSFTYEFPGVSPNLQIGWTSLTYDTGQGRIGGYATFRQTIGGRPDFEALVPLSAFDDHKFYMPFDNRVGTVTAIAIANPDATRSNTVTLQFLTVEGAHIRTESVQLPPNGQTAFLLGDRFQHLAGLAGTVYAQSSLDRLSALGLRFNLGGGNAFSTIPIMNWSGMFAQ